MALTCCAEDHHVLTDNVRFNLTFAARTCDAEAPRGHAAKGRGAKALGVKEVLHTDAMAIEHQGLRVGLLLRARQA
jgi:hypothetical protein